MNAAKIALDGATRTPSAGCMMLPEFASDECEFYARSPAEETTSLLAVAAISRIPAIAVSRKR